MHCCSVFCAEENKTKEICLELGADEYVIVLHPYRYFFHHQSEKALSSTNEFSYYYKEQVLLLERLSLWTSYKVRVGQIRKVFECK